MKMKFNKIILVMLSGLCILGYGCKKGDYGEPKHLPISVPHTPNEFTMFDVKVTLHQSESYAMGNEDEVTISPTDSVLIDYTIESPNVDMYQVALYKGGGGLPSIRIPITEGMDRHSYSGTLMLYGQDIGAGNTISYRIWANDIQGVYLGDGGRKFSVHVTSDIDFYTNRWVFCPDSTLNTEESFVSLSDGELYSYETGAANAGSIDFGLAQRLDSTLKEVGGVPTMTYATHTYIYSLAADPLPFDRYDLGSWTKRATLFSKPKKGNLNDLNSKLNTSAKIEEAAKDAGLDQTIIPADDVAAFSSPLAAGQFIYFVTPEGKYGVILIQSVAKDYRFKDYLQIYWRIQK